MPRGRPKKKNVVEPQEKPQFEVKTEEKPVEETLEEIREEEKTEDKEDMILNGINLEGRDEVSIDEAARALNMIVSDAKRWHDNGILEGSNDMGFRRVLVASIFRAKRKFICGPNM